jgi:hypothetical protein
VARYAPPPSDARVNASIIGLMNIDRMDSPSAVTGHDDPANPSPDRLLGNSSPPRDSKSGSEQAK